MNFPEPIVANIVDDATPSVVALVGRGGARDASGCVREQTRGFPSWTRRNERKNGSFFFFR
jgi:hypothetical protein